MQTAMQMVKGLRTVALAAALLAAAGSFGLAGQAHADNTISFGAPQSGNQISFSAPASGGQMTLVSATPSSATDTMTLQAPEPSGTMTLLAPEPVTGSSTLVLTASAATADTGSHTSQAGK